MGKHAEIERHVGKSAENRGDARHGYRVLLADDDCEMRKLLAWSLNVQGYQVTECKDGNSLMKQVGYAVHYEGVQPFDLIISDIRMPGSNGFQVLESARDFEELPPILLITAFPDDETRKKARELGAIAVFEKPFDIDTLMKIVRQILPLGSAEKRQLPKPALHHSTSLPFPVDITFRHSKGVEAICSFIRDITAKLNPFADHIRQVHVVVEDLSPEIYRKHHYIISIQVVISDDEPIFVSHNTYHADHYENLYLGISIAFGMSRRKLKHSLGKRRTKRFTRRRPRQQREYSMNASDF